VIVPENVGYTLQVAVESDGQRLWVDEAMVLVAPRTVPEEGLDVRLLDAETAEPIRVLPPPREPGPRELRL
jgi:hypothetical protein